MNTYKDRMNEEQKELREKAEKLQNFILSDSEIFNGLPELDVALLHNQLGVMEQYLDILNERIERAV